jgi:hypothetical protein
MPTVPVYVPVNVARAVSNRWGVDLFSADFQEVIRSLCSERLETEAGISHPAGPFAPDCTWAHLHRAGSRCRSCGGS